MRISDDVARNAAGRPNVDRVDRFGRIERVCGRGVGTSGRLAGDARRAGIRRERQQRSATAHHDRPRRVAARAAPEAEDPATVDDHARELGFDRSFVDRSFEIVRARRLLRLVTRMIHVAVRSNERIARIEVERVSYRPTSHVRRVHEQFLCSEVANAILAVRLPLRATVLDPRAETALVLLTEE